MAPITTRYGNVLAHGTTMLDVVYTNDSAMVPFFLRDLKRWLEEDAEEYKFMGLDFEYTADQNHVAVIQLCFKRKVLVFQWASSDKNCPALMDFFLRSGIHFASVDITNDKINMGRSFRIEIPANYHIDLQNIFKLKKDGRTSMADMAVALIDEQYATMKSGFPKEQHSEWEKTPLDKINIEYAAKDAYVSYELYRKIRIVNYAQRHLVQLAPPPVSGDSSDSEYDPYEGYL